MPARGAVKAGEPMLPFAFLQGKGLANTFDSTTNKITMLAPVNSAFTKMIFQVVVSHTALANLTGIAHGISLWKTRLALHALKLIMSWHTYTIILLYLPGQHTLSLAWLDSVYSTEFGRPQQALLEDVYTITCQAQG